jgi:biopolymer transport protein ExbD
MAISISSNAAPAPMGDMNTTPLIDVMLVLLIMFIITLPIQTHAVQIDLPVVTDPTPPPPNLNHNKIVIQQSGALLWNGTPVNYTQLATLLEQTRLIQPNPELQFEPDANASYIIVDQVLAMIDRSHVGAVGFVGNERYRREF